jgi:hypothetical protein
MRALRFVTTMLVGLGLTNTAAHVLELPQKMRWDVDLYTRVNGSLYKYFGLVGGPVLASSVLAAIVHAAASRRRRAAFRWALAGAGLMVGSFASFLAIVQPVNAEVAAAAPADRPEVWTRLRDRWEYGHATGFALHLLGFGAVVAAAVAETPSRA